MSASSVQEELNIFYESIAKHASSMLYIYLYVIEDFLSLRVISSLIVL